MDEHYSPEVMAALIEAASSIACSKEGELHPREVVVKKVAEEFLVAMWKKYTPDPE